MNRALVREVWDLVLPVILQGMVVTVVFFTDRLLLGQYDETTLASMQVSGPLLWSIFSVFAAFIAGTMAVIGRAVGANDPERAQRTLSSVLVFGFGVGIVVASVCMVLRPWFADVLAGGGGSVAESAQKRATLYRVALVVSMPQGVPKNLVTRSRGTGSSSFIRVINHLR
jgi:Na+-driven multidrug efflux pump